jgi:hypothetical protein
MAPNVVRADPIIKHVFEACRVSTSGRIEQPKFVGGLLPHVKMRAKAYSLPDRKITW